MRYGLCQISLLAAYKTSILQITCPTMEPPNITYDSPLRATIVLHWLYWNCLKIVVGVVMGSQKERGSHLSIATTYALLLHFAVFSYYCPSPTSHATWVRLACQTIGSSYPCDSACGLARRVNAPNRVLIACSCAIGRLPPSEPDAWANYHPLSSILFPHNPHLVLTCKTCPEQGQCICSCAALMGCSCGEHTQRFLSFHPVFLALSLVMASTSSGRSFKGR